MLVCGRVAWSACAGVRAATLRSPDPMGDPPPGPCSASCAGPFEAAGLGSGGGRSDSSSQCSGPAPRLTTGGPGAHLSRCRPSLVLLTRRLPPHPLPAPATHPPPCCLPETGLNSGVFQKSAVVCRRHRQLSRAFASSAAHRGRALPADRHCVPFIPLSFNVDLHMGVTCPARLRTQL